MSWKKALIIILTLLSAGTYSMHAQLAGKSYIRGAVVDGKNGEPVPYAVIVVDGTTDGTGTDSEGRFLLVTTAKKILLKISSMGYLPSEVSIPSDNSGKPAVSEPLTIRLSPAAVQLDAIVVKANKVRYRNKDNPAVMIIDSVIHYKEMNRSKNFDFLSYEKYEKVIFSFSNVSEKLKEAKMLGKFKFVFDNMDTLRKPGQPVLPVYIREQLSDYYYRRTPEAKNEIVKGDKMVTFEGYLDEQGIGVWLNYLYQDIDLYDNNILFLTNQFISPIAVTAPAFYRYYIMDTLNVSGAECYKLYFSPRNKTDFLFQGYLYITADGSFAVKRAEIEVSRQINLNWIKDARIVQEFERDPEKGVQQAGVNQHTGTGQKKSTGWLLTLDEISLDLGYSRNGLGVYGQKSVSYRKFKINEPLAESNFRVRDARADTTLSKPESYWEENRHTMLSATERGIYRTIDTLKKIPAFKRTMNITRIILASYHNFGKFEIGPVISFYSYNPIEGSKLRIGGRSTTALSKWFNYDGYISYSFGDRKIKYNLGTTLSFSGRTIYEFPVQSLRLSFQSDTKVPGQELYFVQEGNALLSIKRGVDDKLFYNKTFRAEYLHEFENHFSYSLGYTHTQQKPGGSITFGNASVLNIGEASLALRYAPKEEFYQRKIYRIPVANKYPIFQFNYTFGSKLLGGDYNYHLLRLNIYKRFYPSVVGYTTVTLEGGLVLGKVPYPLLEIHNANQSYLYQSTTYNLMNFVEFVSDKYASLFVDHCFNGFIFNKIPLIKHLGLREMLTFKVLYGGLSNKSNPAISGSNVNPPSGSVPGDPLLFPFPVDKDGNPATFILGKTPYVEMSVGISNIFKFVRVDLVRRITYLDHPNVSKYGIRVRLKFDL